jgi:two-component system cell cycle response regulator DivK
MPHILIIEDYRDNREVTELILQEAGYRVTTATNGLRGVQLATRTTPDLILMDLGLPVLDGWEATRRLKANPTTRHIPVIAFTAYVTPEDLTSARAAGCVTVIAKPFEIDTLLTQVAAGVAPQEQRPDQRTGRTGQAESSSTEAATLRAADSGSHTARRG